MKFEIKNRHTGSVQASVEIDARYESESLSVQLGAAIRVAYRDGAYLRGANLVGAYLRGANLVGADLGGANLEGADLWGANLVGADLRGANLGGANLEGADLKGAYLGGANLEGADLKGAYLGGANLEGAYLVGAFCGGEPIRRATPEESIANLDKVREIVMENEERLHMGHWHNGEDWRKRTCAEEAVCGTTHCLAGWLQVCATDPKVREMDPQLAGIVQAPVAAKMFFRDGQTALEWLRERKYAEEAKEYA
jgi:hypothetical protein